MQGFPRSASYWALHMRECIAQPASRKIEDLIKLMSAHGQLPPRLYYANLADTRVGGKLRQ